MVAASTIVLCAACSIFAVLLLCATYLGVAISPPSMIVLLALSSAIAVPLAGSGRPFARGATLAAGTESSRVWGFGISLLPCAVLLPGIAALLLSTRMQISYHGFFHCAYIGRLLAGQIPPENVTLPGHPANVYWPYHALLAVLSTIFKAPAPLVSSVLNIVTLLGVVSLAAVLLDHLDRSGRSVTRTCLALFSVFGGNLLGSVHAMLKPRAAVCLATPSGADPRLGSLLGKFLNFNSFPLAIALFLVALLCVIRSMEGRSSRREPILLAIIGLGSLALHTTTGVFMLVTMPLALVGALWLNATLAGGGQALNGWRARHQRAGFYRLIGILAVVLAFPVLAVGDFVVSASRAMSKSLQMDWGSYYDIFSIGSVTIVLIPFFVAGTYQALKRNNVALMFLSLVAMTGYALAFLVELPDRNEYKFIYLSTIAASTVGATVLRQLLRQRHARWIAIGLMVLLLANLTVAGVCRFIHPWFRDETVVYRGTRAHADAQQSQLYADLQYADVYEWARDVTPPDTVIIIPKVERDLATVYVLAERVPYVVDGRIYNSGIRDCKLRSRQLRVVYSQGAAAQDKLITLEAIRRGLPGRPMVLVYPNTLSLDRAVIEAIGADVTFTGSFAAGYFLPSWLDRGGKIR